MTFESNVTPLDLYSLLRKNPPAPNPMARKSLLISQQRKLKGFLEAKAAGKKPIFPTRVYNRCNLCGRRHGFIRFFGVCRICFRELASNGDIPGITKSSW